MNGSNEPLYETEKNDYRRKMIIEKRKSMGLWEAMEHYQGGILEGWWTCPFCFWTSSHVTNKYIYCPGCGEKLIGRGDHA